MMEDLFTTGADIEAAITQINRQYIAMTHKICQTCRLWHTPRCYERQYYGRDAGAQDYCAGHKRRGEA